MADKQQWLRDLFLAHISGFESLSRLRQYLHYDARLSMCSYCMAEHYKVLYEIVVPAKFEKTLNLGKNINNDLTENFKTLHF